MNFGEWLRFHLLNDDSSDLLGKYGEDLTARKLKWTNLFGYKGLMLRNAYIPAEIGETTEIDLIYITQKGLFIIESKNFSGWIFGRESDRYWTQCLPDKTRLRFFNPIWQNRGHIKWLRSFLHDENLPCFSIIVFSERCSLKKLDYRDETCAIIHRDELFSTVRSVWKNNPDRFDENGIKSIYDMLSILKNADEAMKQAHIDRIRNAYEKKQDPAPCGMPLPDAAEQPVQESAIPESPAVPVSTAAETPPTVCPRCGSALILRTAARGENAGKQFYGCSAFPKCRYIKTIEQSQEESPREKNGTNR